MKFEAGFTLIAQADPITLCDMAQTLDGVGFDYVTTAGHLLCAPSDIYTQRPLPTYVGPFREGRESRLRGEGVRVGRVQI